MGKVGTVGTQLLHANAHRLAVRALDAAHLESCLEGERMPSQLEPPV